MSLADLSGVIFSLSSGTYTVTRRSAATYTAGRKNSPTTSTFEITASAQPLTGNDLKRMPEGLQTQELKNLWVAGGVELYTESTAHAADYVSIDGETWQVQNVERWDNLGGYFKVIVAKVNNT